MVNLNPAENPYLQWILRGRHATALPYALRAENFHAIRQNLDRLEWHAQPIETILDANPSLKIDRFNLSNIFEYMSAENYHDVDLRHPGKVDPVELTRQLQQHVVSSGVASPALWARVVQYAVDQQVQLPKLQKVFTGGAPVFPRLLRQMQQVMPNAQVIAVYGSTEAEPMVKVAYRDIRAYDEASMSCGQRSARGHSCARD